MMKHILSNDPPKMVHRSTLGGVTTVEKGTYYLDFNSDKVIMDGYEFVKSEYPGIYKCIDDCVVNWSEWYNDERNRDLTVYVKSLKTSNQCAVLYLCKWDNKYRSDLWREKFAQGCDEGYKFDFIQSPCHECFKNGFIWGLPIL